MARKKTEVEKAYAKELARIKRTMTYAGKLGIKFNENIIPDKPAKITKASINKLKDITKETIYQAGEYTLPTGEVVTGDVGKKYTTKLKQDRRKANGEYYPNGVDIVVTNLVHEYNKTSDTSNPDIDYQEIIQSFRHEIVVNDIESKGEKSYHRNRDTIAEYRDTILRYIDSVLGSNNDDEIRALADRIENNAEPINDALQRLFHDSDPRRLSNAGAEILYYIKESPLTFSEAKNIGAESDVYDDYEEYNEDY